MRVAERLGSELAVRNSGTVVVAQRRRTHRTVYHAAYVPLASEWLETRWDSIVVFRRPSVLIAMKRAFPDAGLFLWLEDLADQRLFHPAIAATQPVVVTVSAFHQRNVIAWLARCPPEPFPPIIHIFNPIDDDLNPQTTPIKRNKLIFFSSPNKGLAWTLDVFVEARRANPAFELCVANPGYMRFKVRDRMPDGVHEIGVVPHKEALRHVQESLCVFCLNDVYPETFGCVFAEANAVGTPVLTHPCGAAPEILTDADQLIDVRDRAAVIKRLLAWYEGARPHVGPDARFRTSTVIAEWKRAMNIDSDGYLLPSCSG